MCFVGTRSDIGGLIFFLACFHRYDAQGDCYCRSKDGWSSTVLFGKHNVLLDSTLCFSFVYL